MFKVLKRKLKAEISLVRWTDKQNALIFLEKMVNEHNQKQLISNLGFNGRYMMQDNFTVARHKNSNF